MTLGLLAQFPAATISAQEVSFADANLEAAVRLEIGKPEGAILASDLKEITSLRAPNTAIQSLAGLEYCVNLEVLVLDSDLRIEDLSPLSGLTKLRGLYLFFNKLSDISPLAGLHNLEVLNLEDNFISDLSPLSGLTNLKALNLMDNHIEDITPLLSLVNLEWLSVTNNRINDISSLSALPNLKTILLDGNRISNISPLLANEGIGAGDELRLQNNPLSYESYYEYLPQLEAKGVVGLDNIAPPVEETASLPEPEGQLEPPPASMPDDASDFAADEAPPFSFWIVAAAVLFLAIFWYGGYLWKRRRL